MSSSSSGARSPAPHRASRAGSWQWIGATARRLCSSPAGASSCMRNWQRRHAGEWGYRRMTTYGGILAGSSAPASRGARPGWLSPNVSIHGQLGSTRHHSTGAAGGIYRRDDACSGSAWSRVAAGQRHGAAAPRRKGGGRRSRRRNAQGRCGRDRNGALVSARGAMASPPARVRVEGTQPCLRDRICDSTGGAVSRIRGEPTGSILSPEIFPRADGTTYVCAISSNSPCQTDPGLVVPDDGAIDRLKALCARISPDAGVVACSCEPSLLSPGNAGRTPADRRHPGRTWRVCSNRPWCLGHSQRARDRRSGGRVDPRRGNAGGRSLALRSRTPRRRGPRPCHRRTQAPWLTKQYADITSFRLDGPTTRTVPIGPLSGIGHGSTRRT